MKLSLSTSNANEMEKLIHHFSVDNNLLSLSYKISSEDLKKAVEDDEV